jgi:hypothetical protein
MGRLFSYGERERPLYQSAEGDPDEEAQAICLVLLLVCVHARSQDTKPTGDQTKSEATASKELSKKPVSITGVVGTDGLTLVGDKDNKSYKVINPHFLKERAGQHVRVNARVSKDNAEIQVSSEMVVSDEPVAANKGDAAFRR